MENKRDTPNRVELYQSAAVRALTDGNDYKGLQIHALPGLHAYAAELLQRFVAPGSDVLDMAAGSGAMSRRLSDLGYRVTATDLVTDNFRLRDSIDFRTANLDQEFAPCFSKRYKGIVALEIIEHLENPRYFLRQCYELLESGGALVLSTPNTNNPVSQAMFAKDGHFLWFSDEDYQKDGHISPISVWFLGKCLTEIGFRVGDSSSFGDPFRHVKGLYKLKFLAKLIALFTRQDRRLLGEILTMVLIKP